MIEVEQIKLYSILSLIILLLIWKFWRDGNFKQGISAKLSEIIEKNNEINKELETLIIEIDESYIFTLILRLINLFTISILLWYKIYALQLH